MPPKAGFKQLKVDQKQNDRKSKNKKSKVNKSWCRIGGVVQLRCCGSTVMPIASHGLQDEEKWRKKTCSWWNQNIGKDVAAACLGTGTSASSNSYLPPLPPSSPPPPVVAEVVTEQHIYIQRHWMIFNLSSGRTPDDDDDDDEACSNIIICMNAELSVWWRDGNIKFACINSHMCDIRPASNDDGGQRQEYTRQRKISDVSMLWGKIYVMNLFSHLC